MRKLEKWVDKRLNPIILQETRHVLSLKLSLVVYVGLVLVLSTSSCNMSKQSGEEISWILLGAFSFIAVTIIPAQLLFSSATRWSRQKLEMMQLTPLRPLDIAAGRVGAALMIVILILSVVVPFLSLTYLVPGADLSINLMSAVMLLFISLFAITSSINIAWVSEQFSFHLIGKIIWLGMLFQAGIAAAAVPALLHEISQDGKISLGILVVWFCLGAFLASCFAFARSIVFLRHPEENRTTPVRSTLLLGLLFVFLSVTIPLLNSFDDFEAVFFAFVISAFAVFCAKFLLDSDKIGQRALIDLPKAKWKRLLLLPVLPGAGTGILLMASVLFGLAIFFEGVNLWKLSKGGRIDFGGYWYMSNWWFAISAAILPLFRNILGSERKKTAGVFVYYFLIFMAIMFLLIVRAIDPDDESVLSALFIPFVGADMIQDGDAGSFALIILSTIAATSVFLINSKLIYDNVSIIMRAEYEPPKRSDQESSKPVAPEEAVDSEDPEMDMETEEIQKEVLDKDIK